MVSVYISFPMCPIIPVIIYGEGLTSKRISVKLCLHRFF